MPKEVPDGATYLRVNTRFLLQLNPSTSQQPNPPSQPPPSIGGNLNVITAPLHHLQQFTDNTVDWLIRFAELALEPHGAGVLYTFRTQSVQYWLEKEMDDSWRKVAAGEVLQPTIYEYRRADQQATEPTRVCIRQDRSVTRTTSSRDQASAFRTALLTRHAGCIISGQTRTDFVAASHLIPRRLGDIGVQAVFQRFTGLSTPVTRYHASLGVPLNLYLAQLADTFQLGFWDTGNGRYQIHVFLDDGENLGLNGIERTHSTDSLLHRHTITVGPDPPSGVFDWHYVQCVLQRFATEEYRRLHNIAHFSFPFRTRDEEDDSDREFDDPRNIENPPYPSYLMDLAWMRNCQQADEEESRQEVERWRSGVSRAA